MRVRALRESGRPAAVSGRVPFAAPVMLLVLAVVLGGVLRLVSVAHKITPGHDEAVSYIHATCHADEYERVVAKRSYPHASQPRQARGSGSGMSIGRCAFQRSRGGLLTRTSIHRSTFGCCTWSLITGVGLSQAVWLNLLLVTLTAGALFGLGREAFGDDVDAGLLAAIWVLSPATIGTSTRRRAHTISLRSSRFCSCGRSCASLDPAVAFAPPMPPSSSQQPQRGL